MSHSKLGATVAFVVTALVAAILLISALVFWFGELIGSHLLAMVIIGGGCAVASWLTYSLSLRPIVKKVEEQLSTIYEVASAARRAYAWVVEYLLDRVFKGSD